MFGCKKPDAIAVQGAPRVGHERKTEMSRTFPAVATIAVIVVLAVLFTDRSWETQQKAAAYCSGATGYSHQSSDYVKCMNSHGYELDFTSDRCRPVSNRSPYCYVPISGLGRYLAPWEMGHGS
jgi:hypothetical protein